MVPNRQLAIVLALAFTLLTPGGTAAAQSVGPATATVTYQVAKGEVTQTPDAISVTAGNTVVWELVNEDTSGPVDFELVKWKNKNFFTKHGDPSCMPVLKETVTAGTPVRVSFTPDAKCFKPLTKKGKTVLFKYNIRVLQGGKQKHEKDPELEIAMI